MKLTMPFHTTAHARTHARTPGVTPIQLTAAADELLGKKSTQNAGIERHLVTEPGHAGKEQFSPTCVSLNYFNQWQGL